MARPIAAGVLTIIGGLFILFGAVLFAALGLVFAVVFHLVSGFFFVGLIVGGLTLLVGVLMLAVPSVHVTWGVFAIVLAIVSIFFAIAGLVIGFILTVIGGGLAIAWKPPPEPAITVTAQPVPPPTG